MLDGNVMKGATMITEHKGQFLHCNSCPANGLFVKKTTLISMVNRAGVWYNGAPKAQRTVAYICAECDDLIRLFVDGVEKELQL